MKIEKSEDPDKGRSNQRSKNKGRKKFNANKHGKKKGVQKQSSQSTFEGSIKAMNGLLDANVRTNHLMFCVM